MVETRNGSDQVIAQHVWGGRYLDELVQVAVNSDPSADATCDRLYPALHDANFNVAGLWDQANARLALDTRPGAAGGGVGVGAHPSSARPAKQAEGAARTRGMNMVHEKDGCPLFRSE